MNQSLVVKAHARFVAKLAIDIEGEMIAFDQTDLAAGELADPDLGALQVGKHTDITAESRGDVAHHAYQSSMPIGRPMRKIDPHDIDAGKNHSLDGGRIT